MVTYLLLPILVLFVTALPLPSLASEVLPFGVRIPSVAVAAISEILFSPVISSTALPINAFSLIISPVAV